MAEGPQVVVVGLGNPILSDDAVGIRVSEVLADRLDAERVRVTQSTRGGLDLVDLITGFREAHIIDAILLADHEPGEVLRIDPAELPPSLTLASSHEVDLPTALELATRLGYEVPERIFIWAIVVVDPFTVAEQLSPPVREAVTTCAEKIGAQLGAARP